MGGLTYSYLKVFPGIGIARIGNSPDDFFIGPEAPGIVPEHGGSYKDGSGRVKRQAARFRVYAFDDDGGATELTADHPDVASIHWTVTLANHKAEWYAFSGTRAVAEILERGDAADKLHRNPNVQGEARRGLIIGPSTGEISGRGTHSDALEGTFMPSPSATKRVYLGELRTDPSGRLLVLGGRGESESLPKDEDNPLGHYSNNDGWHDDVSDGPVSAVVTFKDGRRLEARGRAWVIVAPPHYSPHTRNVVTLLDVMTETAVRRGLPWNESELGPKPGDDVSFTRDIYPILERMAMYQWVSRRAQRGHAAGKPGDLLDPDVLARLADPAVAGRPDSPQKRIFGRIRTPIRHPPFDETNLAHTGLLDPQSQAALNQANLSFMPPLAGDEGDVRHPDVWPQEGPEDTNPTETWLTLTETQYRMLGRWKDGDFAGDWTASAPVPVPFAEIPVGRQPRALVEAALEWCQGGAFFPGIEITSIARFGSFYGEAFRVGDHLEAGDVTKWMALPWQADFYECRDHWWPSVRPDDVVPVGDYERILEEFRGEAQQGRLATLLGDRKPWARGVGLELPARPDLPKPRDGEAPGEYRNRCARLLGTLARSLIARFLPVPLTNEPGPLYQRRIEEFLGRTILGGTTRFRMPPFDGQTPLRYREVVAEALGPFLGEQTRVPGPVPGEATADYAARLAEHAAGQRVWQGLLDLEWRRRDRHRGKNDLVQQWSRLGFVVPRTRFGETVFVEADRGRYDLIPFRQAFYYLMNLEQYPEFLPTAEELAREYVRLAAELEPTLRADPTTEQYGYFAYDAVTFRARMEKIYETERRAAAAYNPVSGEGEPLFRTPAQVVERIRQLAPFNQLDGSWLEKITKSGPINEISAFLFEIWSDEIGNGDPAQNHANVYTDLMRNAGIYLPPINSLAYAEHPDLWDSSFSSPAYQAAIAHFPETFYPELLGMTLYLEWEAVFLPAMVKLYDYHGHNSLFYRLHVAIDNPVNGHGARARDAVVRYLDHVRSESGEQEMQEHWRRIWNGYLAFRFVGGDEWQYRFTSPATLDERMLAMLEQKRHYGQLNHGPKRFGPNLINDWLDEPDQFLEFLAGSDLITKGDAASSRIFELMSPTGPMLKVFTAQDRQLWADWINAMPRDPAGGALGPGEAMELLIREFRGRGVAVPDHAGFRLKGRYADPAADDRLVEADESVDWWFRIDQPRNFMAALADPGNGWVFPGNPAGSRLVTDLLSDTSRMARALTRTVPELGDRPARMVIIDWIAAGCPIPEAPSVRAESVPRAAVEVNAPAVRPLDADEYNREVTRRSLNAAPLSPDQRRGLRRRFYGPGGGAAH